MNQEIIKLTGETSNDPRSKELITHFSVTGEFGLMDSYIRDAKRILDKESKLLNDEGIKRLVAALMVEVYGNENYGSDN